MSGGTIGTERTFRKESSYTFKMGFIIDIYVELFTRPFSGITNKERPKAILTLINSIKERVGKKKKMRALVMLFLVSLWVGSKKKILDLIKAL